MRLLIFLCFITFFHSATAQFVIERKILLPFYNPEKPFGIVPTGNDGLVLYHESTHTMTSGKRIWQVVFLDKNLDVTWDSSFESEMNFVISEVKYASGYVYLLFQDISLPVKSVFFVRCKINSRKFEFFQISEFLPAEILGFEILGSALFLVGKNYKRPAILKFNFGDPRPLALKGLFDQDSEIVNVSVDRQHRAIQIVSKLKKAGKSMILVKKFDESGNNIRDILLESSKGYQMINGVASTDSAGNTAIVGTFSYKRTKLSNGVFTAVFNAAGSNQVYYYDYVNLHNYFDFLSDVSSIEKAKRKYRNKRDGSSYSVNHMPRTLAYENGEWQFLGEVFQVTEHIAKAHGRVRKRELTEFSHAIALGMDNEGKLKWDDTFMMSKLIALNTNQQTYLFSGQRDPVVFFTDGFNLIHKNTGTGNKDSTNNYLEIDAFQAECIGDKAERHGNMTHWHDNVFIIYGENTLYSSQAEPRHSFFILKLAVIDPLDE